jgi:hypothetical protein
MRAGDFFKRMLGRRKTEILESREAIAQRLVRRQKLRECAKEGEAIIALVKERGLSNLTPKELREAWVYVDEEVTNFAGRSDAIELGANWGQAFDTKRAIEKELRNRRKQEK